MFAVRCNDPKSPRRAATPAGLMQDVRSWRRDEAKPEHRDMRSPSPPSRQAPLPAVRPKSRWSNMRTSTPFSPKRSRPHVHNTILERTSGAIPTDAPWLHDNTGNEKRLEALTELTRTFKGDKKPTVPRKALEKNLITRHGNMFFSIGNLPGVNSTGTLKPQKSLYMHWKSS